MENNPGDSSSESDITEHWSIIDRDSCEPEDIPVDCAVKDRDSVNGEPSDGESLEVIDGEEKHEDEYKDADFETDGISIISDSESDGSNELEQPISLAVSKEKKYLHHPNTYLNTRLNVLLALSFAAVTGLGLGHFLGLQEECPLLIESTTNLLTKLQHDNQLLRYKIEELMSEKDAAAHLFKQVQDRECGTGTMFRSEDVLHMHPSLQAGIQEYPLNLEISDFHATAVGSQPYTSDSRDQYDNDVRNIAQQSPVVRVGRVMVDEDIEYATARKYEEKVSEKPAYDVEKESVTSEPIPESRILANPRESLVTTNMQHVERNGDNDFNDHMGDVTFEHVKACDNFAKFSVELNDAANVKKLYNLVNKHKAVADFPVVMEDEKYSEGFAVKEDAALQSSGQVKDKESVFLVQDEDVVLEHTLTTHSSEGDTSAEVNRNVGSVQPKVVTETYNWKENNIEIIKSTLELLRAQYDDVTPTDTGRILTTSVALVTEVEEILVHLQDTITECEVEKTDFCAQYQKRVEVSLSKLKETAEGLVDDIEEQLHKLVSTIVRKLKKFKGRLQDKWCHLTHKYVYNNDVIYNWLHSSVLLDCKGSDMQARRKFHQYSAKELHKLNYRFVKSTSEENWKGTYVSKSHNTEEEYDIKSVDSSTSSEVDQKNTILVSEYNINNKQRPRKIVINHDSFNEQNFKINTPVTGIEKTHNFTEKERYMSESKKNLKHDIGSTSKRHFDGKEKKKRENKQKSIPQSKACGQKHNSKTVYHKCKNNQQKTLKHDIGSTFKRQLDGKEEKKHKNKQKSVPQSKARGQKRNSKTVGDEYENNQQDLHSENFKGQDHEDSHGFEKKNLKNQFKDRKKKEYKKHETQHSLHNENKDHKRSVILEQHASWVGGDTDTPKQTNVSGDWVLKMANDRAEQRKLEHRSDWVFDRADARKLKREKQHLTANWYFERARGREYCRHYPHSNWCKTGIFSGPNYDWFHQRENENEYHENGRINHDPRWTNKFTPRPFAATGKLIKDYFKYFQNKMNYYSHH